MVGWLAQLRDSGVAYTILIGMSDSAGGASKPEFSAAEKAATTALSIAGGYAALESIGGTGSPFQLREPFVLIGGVGLAKGEGLEKRGGHSWNPDPAQIRLESCVPYKTEKVFTLVGSRLEGGVGFEVQCLSLSGNVECSWERLDGSMRLTQVWTQIVEQVGCDIRLVLVDGRLLNRKEHGEMTLETLFIEAK